MPSFAEIVLAARNARNMSQKEFGQAVGVSGSTIYQAERGLKRPDKTTVTKVADFLGQDLSEHLPEESVFTRSGSRKRHHVRSGAHERLPNQATPALKAGDVSLTDNELALVSFYRGIPEQGRRQLLQQANRLWTEAQQFEHAVGKVGG